MAAKAADWPWNNSVMLDSANVSERHCIYPDLPEFYTAGRFYLLAIIGSMLATFGIFENFLLYKLFTTREKFKGSALYFLAYVALFDMLLDIGFLFVMTPDAAASYYNWYLLHVTWCIYIRYAYALFKICKLTSTLCLIAASVERYRAALLWTFTGFTRYTRFVMLVLAITGGCVVRGPVLFVVSVTHQPRCRGLARYRPDILSISQVSKMWHVLETTLSVGLPFMLLILLNVGIVWQLHRKRVQDLRNLMLKLAVTQLNRLSISKCDLIQEHIDEHDERIRNATRTLACLMFAYLLSNAMHFALATVELISDVDETTPLFRRFSADIVNLCTVLGNVVRLPIYAACDPEVHRALSQFFFQKSITIEQIEPTTVDNIEIALHDEDAILHLRRLSNRRIDELTEQERRLLSDGFMRTMSALHLNQPETLLTPFKRENQNYLSVNVLSTIPSYDEHLKQHVEKTLSHDNDMLSNGDNNNMCPWHRTRSRSMAASSLPTARGLSLSSVFAPYIDLFADDSTPEELPAPVTATRKTRATYDGLFPDDDETTTNGIESKNVNGCHVHSPTGAGRSTPESANLLPQSPNQNGSVAELHEMVPRQNGHLIFRPMSPLMPSIVVDVEPEQMKMTRF